MNFSIHNFLMICLTGMLFIHCTNRQPEPASSQPVPQSVPAATDSLQPQKPEREAAPENKSNAPGKERQKLVYNEKGWIIERHSDTRSKSDGSILSYEDYYYTYDEQGNMIKDITESFTPEWKMKFRNINYYTYNDQKLMIELRFETFDGGGLLQRKALNKYKYNEAGNKTEDVGYYDDGTVKSKIILDYSDSQVLLSEEYIDYAPDGRKTEHKKYHYENFRLVKTEDLLNQ